MKKEKLEKLASTEIAQSRERELQSVCEAIESDWPMRGWQITDLIRPLIRAAERDTRERCAQSTVEYLKSRGITMTNKEWDELGERIGGKV